MSDDDKPQNKKQLPQIQQETELIAQIVKAIRIAAQETDRIQKDSRANLADSRSSELDLSLTSSSSSSPGAGVTRSPSPPPPNSAMVTNNLTPADFTRETARKYNVDRAQIKDFAPVVFSKIRGLLNISTESYVKSWTLPDSKLEMSKGAGRSGSLFLKSEDKRYILKTIPHDELDTFLALLPDYFKYIVENPDSLIMRVVGLHRVKENLTSWIYIIVFTNILYTNILEIDEIYDLKGRVPKPGKSGRNRGKKGIIFKDNDLERVFYLSPDHQPLLIKTLQSDIKFLANHNIMDYSFLIGVARLKKPEDKEALNKLTNDNAHMSLFRRSDGGIVSSSNDEYYFMGIIDCLTDYSTKKKIAHAMKITLWTPESLSTVDATMYSERIIKFMDYIFPKDLSKKTASSPTLPGQTNNNNNNNLTTSSAPVTTTTTSSSPV